VRGSGSVPVQMLAKLVSGRSPDRPGYGQQSGALWSWPMEALSPGGPDAASSFASTELWSAWSQHGPGSQTMLLLLDEQSDDVYSFCW
jgi:hypothetical protein